jgi:two-component system, OmpR family, sensor histidine kinase MprB
VTWWSHPDGEPRRAPWSAARASASAAGANGRADPRHAEAGAADRPGALEILRARANALSLRTRVAALVALGVGIAVTIVSVAAFLTVRVQLYRQLDNNLIDRAQAAVSSPLGDPTALVLVPPGALGAADMRVAIVRSDGRAFSARGPRDAPPLGPQEVAVASGASQQSARTATSSDGRFRVVAVPAAPGHALVLGQSTAATDRTLAALGAVLLIVGLAGVVQAAWAGVVIARQGLRPVERLTAAAEHVARTEELRPIAVDGDDELARLGRAFNSMLQALERSRERQRRLVGDAGHELRTPLTSLRTNLDLLAQSEQQPGLSPQDRAELLADVRAQVEELTGLVSDLVELARDDSARVSYQTVDLADVVVRAVERARRRAPGVRFDLVAEPWSVIGDEQALERAVLNLLDNAGKWSPPGGTVRVRLHNGTVSVADEGPGIAEVDLPYVFDRFYRAQDARTMPGSGLGLAIVRQAAERHGGTASAGRGPTGGAVVTLTVPGSSSAAHG